jgi:hypothetical protein
MARLKGSKNKNTEIPEYTALPTHERIVVIANLIVVQITEDQKAGGTLLRKILEQSHVRPNAS